jgi:hypothetical protein
MDEHQLSTLERGLQTELDIVGKLQSTGTCTVKHTGNDSNSMFDIVVEFADMIPRGIQVKTISNALGSSKFHMKTRRVRGEPYPPRTLLVGANTGAGVYFLAFAEEITIAQIGFNPTHLHRFCEFCPSTGSTSERGYRCQYRW